MDNIIETENLSKHYGDLQAVSSLSLKVRKSEIYGFIGLNGAGKTTTIRMLLGLIKPTYGHVLIDGKRVYAENTELWKKIGHLVEIPYAYPNLTVKENLDIIRRLRSITDRNTVNTVIEKLQLGSYVNVKARNLSHGNAQRLGLAKALIHHPEILILDEPTNGLDPAGKYEIRAMLTEMSKKQGISIFISSHILGEISKFATSIGIIHHGRLIQEINASQLEKLCTKRVLISANNIDAAFSILSQNHYTVKNKNEEILVTTDELAVSKPELIATILVNAGCPPTMLKVEEEDLESYFLRTIGLNGGEK